MNKITEYLNFYRAILIFLKGSFFFYQTKDIEKQNKIIHDSLGDMIRLWNLKVTVEGAENIPGNQQFIVIANHQSLMDIPVLFESLPISMRMVAKAELFRIPVFGWTLRHGYFIPIQRNNTKAAVESLSSAVKLFEKNTSIFMAPEGTRSKDGKLLPFKKGPFVLAIEQKKNILPVVIFDTKDVIVKGSTRIKSNQHVHIKILPVIETQNFTYDKRGELTELAYNIMKKELEG